MRTALRSLAACVLILALPAADAAEPTPALTSAVPASAVAAFTLRRDGLALVRRQLDQDPAMRAELHDFLERTVGVDPSASDAVAGWLESLDPPVGAVLLRLAGQGRSARPRGR